MSKKSRFLKEDNTEKVYSSPREEGTFLYFSGSGDLEDKVGEGTPFRLDNTEAKEYSEIVTGFNENVFLKDGFVFWENAKLGDSVSLDIFLPANEVYPSVQSTGNAGIVDEDGTIDYITDSSTPDETWTGTHIKFPIDVTLFRFVNKFNLLGTNTQGIMLPSSDLAEVEKVLKFKFSFKSETSNPDLTVAVLIEMYRNNTI